MVGTRGGADGVSIVEARGILDAARNVLVLTGAGVSADSGLATFRGAQGHWRRHRPEDLATPEAFRRDPRLVWEWYEARRRAAAASVPNAAHEAIAAFALRRPDAFVVTQNVDGLHTVAARAVGREAGDTGRTAGSPLERLLELHGCFFRVRCTTCGRRREHRDPVDTSAAEALPRCRDCAGLLRPDVVWFGEPLGEAIDLAFARAARSEVCLVIGTSAVVQPAAAVAMVVRRTGGVIIEVNPEPTPLTPESKLSFRSAAAAVVPALLASAALG